MITNKKAKAAEMHRYLDGHAHLTTLYFTDWCRPIILDVPVMSKEEPLVVNNELTGVIAAQYEKDSIAIIDGNAANDVMASGALIQYVVLPGSPRVTLIEDLNEDDVVRHFYHVETIGEALAHIKSQILLVAEQADLKDPFRMEKALWPYMMAREIRIVGSFKHVADGIRYANQLLVHTPTDDVRRLFTTRTVGRRTFEKNNMALMFKAYNEKKASIEEVNAPNVSAIDPYLAAALINLRSTDGNIPLGVEFFFHTKNKDNLYRIKDIPDSEEDLLILDTDQYREWMPDFSKIIVTDSDSQKAAAENTNSRILAFMDSKLKAVNLLRNIMRAMKTNPEQQDVMNLKGITRVHVFMDVITDAHSLN